ncbi:hypothetical protein GCM10010112_57480 [Actinoplanes lobatus]|uniref:Zinc-finger domain-containing protein n=1 Tax=Actinoplanes lobatus TaxID=113568 RepID=A0A7W7MF59_9ACTN|nr:zf-HC2 domain-containing protein [Actinoplanes lobatus]MBB4747933.1 hypothetical protein [Actinoplanes lobatus]GGN81256.1 hypothetical protein GCM10010112_57480 [Actinoplanes lobatus]GIE41600.1 hypothetical protein Alo02nite_44980 [Actinoplanes lobatus]
MSEWHIDPELLEQYEQGVLNPSRVMAVEAHMSACATCRGRIPVDITWLTGNWSIVFDNIHAPQAGPVQRFLTRVGLPEHRFRLLTATPALRWSWLIATVSVVVLAVIAASLAAAGDTGGASRLFLILAPVLPVVAVSGAYGSGIDPMHEITGTTPSAGPALVLWRAISVIGAATALAGVAGLLLPGPGWYAAAWLLPALLLCTGTLALATVWSLQAAAVALGGLWLTGVSWVLGARSEVFVPLVFGPIAQFVYLAAAAAAVAVLIRRRRHFDLGESR